MATIYRDEDVDLSVLRTRRVGVIGYGNQGRAQALNLRDSGVEVMIGNRYDEYREQALRDGFAVVPVAAVAQRCDTLLILIPDEVQPEVFASSIEPHLRPDGLVCFASGYNIFYKAVHPPESVDVVLVAPRMIGSAVRRLYQEDAGYPCLVGVERDASGHALERALAIAKGIGATRLGAFASSFREETLIDLFAEQMLWPGINKLCLLYFGKLVANGCDPDIVATELHLSGEFLEIARAMIVHGFFQQLKLHSHTSQYGQLSRADAMAPPALLEQADAALAGILSGAFAREWAAEQARGLPTLKELWDQAVAHPLNRAEERLEPIRRAAARVHGVD